jgi:hypothetical protein
LSSNYTPQNFSFYGSNQQVTSSNPTLLKNVPSNLSQSDVKSSLTELKNSISGNIYTQIGKQKDSSQKKRKETKSEDSSKQGS